MIAEQAEVKPDTPGSWLQLAIVLVEMGKGIGDCGIHFHRDEPRHVELGITLARTHQGRGVATEALLSVLDYAFGSLGKHRAFAVTDTENLAAAGLFRRLGFRQEAHFVEHVWFKGAWGSEYLFELLDREWQVSRSGRT
jgi:RimJ/RimL family protein N-acetyltransferase